LSDHLDDQGARIRHYLAKAEEALLLAEDAHDDGTRADLRKLAAGYRALAAQIENRRPL
jgi:hypothetical protein